MDDIDDDSSTTMDDDSSSSTDDIYDLALEMDEDDEMEEEMIAAYYASQAHPSAESVKIMAMIAANSTARLESLQLISAMRQAAKITKVRSKTNEKRDQASKKELEFRRTLEKQHYPEFKAMIKRKEAALIKQALTAIDNDELSLSDCSTDSVDAASSIALVAKQVAHYAKKRRALETRLQGYKEQLDHLHSATGMDSEVHESDASEPVAKPKKRRRLASADHAEPDSDA